MATKSEILQLINEGIDGGELATRLGPPVRMDMISSGFNPMHSEDVKSYLEGRKPVVGGQHAAGVDQFKSLGNSNQDDRRDYAQISTGFEENPKVVNPKFERPVLEDTYRPKDLGAMLEKKYALEGPPQRQPSRQPQQRQQQKAPIGGIQTSKAVMLTEQKNAGKAGFQRGSSYLQAFINNIKTPSVKTRLAFIESINQMIEEENSFSTREQLQEYYAGVSVAEKKLYEQIKKA